MARAKTTPAVDETPAEAPTVEELLGSDDPYQLVRANDATTGAEYTTTRVAALNAGSAVLTKPARDQFGRAARQALDRFRRGEIDLPLLLLAEGDAFLVMHMAAVS